MGKQLPVICFLLLVLTQARALEIHSYAVGAGAGLPSTDIRSIAQDDKGYIWLGTTNGLIRYDGYSFNSFFATPTGNRSLLFDNHIRDLFYWKDNLLVIKVQGLHYVLFDTDTDQFLHFPIDQSQLKAYDRITIDSRQRLWLFNSRREGVCVTYHNHTFSVDTYNNNPVPDTVCPRPDFFYDNGENLIEITTPYSLVYHDAATGRTHPIRICDREMSDTPYMLYYAAVTQDNLVWISSYGYGIVVYDKTTGQTTHIRKTDGLIQTDFILKIIPDRQGNIWALQEYRGAVCLSVNTQSPELVNLNGGKREEQANFVKSLTALHHGGCFGSNNAGEIVDIDKGLNITKRTALAGRVILSACKDHKNRIWMGSRTDGVFVNGRWFSADDGNPNALSDNKINSMVCDSAGRVWMATQNGYLNVALGDCSTGNLRFRHFRLSDHLFTLALDHKGHIWAGGQSYAYSFDPNELLRDSGAYREYDIKGSPTGVSEICHIMEDSRHNIWIGTAGKGVFVCKNDGNRIPVFRQMSTKDGMVNDMVASIIEDAYGTIWIATQQGITCYKPETGKMQNIFSAAATTRNFYTDRAACRLSDGRLAFGTIDGIIVYTPSEHFPERKGETARMAPTLAITDIMVNGIAIHQKEEYAQLPAVPTMDKVTLHHQENSIVFMFSDFDYNALHKTKYSYTLEGYDRQWSSPSTAARASYRELPYGHYTFYVKAIDDRNDTEELCRIGLIINPPLWLSWWAWLIYVLLAMVAGWIACRQLRTVYRLRQSVALEKQMTEFKLRFFTNVSHEFRTPLSIIHGSLDRIRQHGQLPDDLKQPLHNISRGENRLMWLINQLLEFRKMESGKLQLALQETNIVGFIRHIFNGFVEMAESKHISFTFQPRVWSLMVYIDRGFVDKIAYNLISNAIKYTPPGGEVCVSIQVDEGHQRFTFSVTDTGVGISKEKQAELFLRFTQNSYRSDSIGIGLNLTKELVEVHHGHVTFCENSPQGSIFTVDLPTDKSVYSLSDFLKENNELIKEQEKESSVAGKYGGMIPKPFNDRTIMVVEDDMDVQRYIKDLMGRYFNVVTATDGSDALKSLESLSVDLIITDVMMPVMNGYELTRKLNADERYQDIPVIMLTAASDTRHEAKGLDVGADAYLTKPFENEVLVSTCISLIEKRDLLRKRFSTEQREDASLPKVIREEADSEFIAIFDRWIEQHLGDADLSVDDMAAAMQSGRTAFYKKVKALTGMTPNDYLRRRRLERAASMLKTGHSNISEVAYKTGFSNPHSFTASFKQHFGTTPKKYQMGKE